MKSNSARVGGGRWNCFMCGKVTTHIGNMRQHFETHHFGAGVRLCPYCRKTFKTKHSLATHMSKNHREERSRENEEPKGVLHERFKQEITIGISPTEGHLHH